MKRTVTIKQKVYIEILQQLRMIIEEDGLNQGDKLPSERELAERLQVARSSVREALRALELVGLIETRRGEGTFIKDAEKHELIQVIAAFVLQAKHAKDDLRETTELIELQALNLARVRINEEEQNQVSEVFHELRDYYERTGTIHMTHHEKLYKLIVQASKNHLLLRIWMMLNNYYQTVCDSASPLPFRHYEQIYYTLLDDEKS
ncbi:GntR family transcriptional regulator [Bacillus tianshenii]|nr:GntR family transcriptional regulator [Bacillus tianshenii]